MLSRVFKLKIVIFTFYWISSRCLEGKTTELPTLLQGTWELAHRGE